MSRFQEEKPALDPCRLTDIDGAHTGALLRLSSFVEADCGFQFIIASCEDSRYQGLLIAYLHQLHPGQKVLDVSGFSEMSQFEASLLKMGPTHPPLIHVVGANLWMRRPDKLSRNTFLSN